MKSVKPPVMTAGASLQEQTTDPDRFHEIGQVFKIVGGSWEWTSNSLKNEELDY